MSILRVDADASSRWHGPMIALVTFVLLVLVQVFAFVPLVVSPLDVRYGLVVSISFQLPAGLIIWMVARLGSPGWVLGATQAYLALFGPFYVFKVLPLFLDIYKDFGVPAVLWELPLVAAGILHGGAFVLTLLAIRRRRLLYPAILASGISVMAWFPCTVLAASNGDPDKPLRPVFSGIRR